MAGKKSLICMAFDGDYVTERLAKFDTISDAWKHAEGMGSKWFFYPFCFVTGSENKMVIDAPKNLRFLIGKSVKTVAKFFDMVSNLPEAQNADPEIFTAILWMHEAEM